MQTHPLKAVVATAKSLSPYYRDLYTIIDPAEFSLPDLPVVESKSFWEANCTGSENRVLTGAVRDGIIFKSGGTTGSPKHSYYSKAEWDSMSGCFGRFQEHNGFQPGDVVANIFYAGELYSSFLFLHEAMRACPVNVTLLPLAGNASPELITRTMLDFQGNVILGIPTEIVVFAEYVTKNGINDLRVERIYFGGESFYSDQKDFVQSVFPGVRICSIGYASVDAGLLGFCDQTCKANEHRPFDGHNIIEILDEQTKEPIEDAGQPGILYTTNLSRLLMPVIRYPVGDRGVWVDPPGTPFRRFKVLGRTEAGARIGTVTLYPDDVRRVLDDVLSGLLHDFQLKVEHSEQKDSLTLVLGVDAIPPNSRELSESIIQALYKQREHLLHEYVAGHIHSPRVKWGAFKELKINPRTGKRIRILDKRFDDPASV